MITDNLIKVAEMSYKLGVPRTTIRDRIFRLKIKGFENREEYPKTIYYTLDDFTTIKESFKSDYQKKFSKVRQSVKPIDYQIKDVVYINYHIYESKINKL